MPKGDTTIPSDSAANHTSGAPKIYAPIGGKPAELFGSFGEARPGHTHSGIDIGCPVGTPCIAPVDGRITEVCESCFGEEGGMIHFQFLEDLGPIKKGDIIGWGHAVDAKVSKGQAVKAGQLLGKSNYESAPHVHFIYQPGGGGELDGTADPLPAYTYLRTEGKDSSGFDGSGTPSGEGGSGSANADEIAAIAKGAAISTFINLPGILESAESLALKGERSLMNDEPLLPFVEQLCQGSLRNFMSMPNGNFYAFIPDYFGGLTGRTAYWEIHDIEILNGEIELSDDALATHVYVVGDTGTIDASIDLLEKWQTSGVVTVFNAFMADFLTGVDVPALNRDGKTKVTKQAKEEYDKKLAKMPNLAEKEKAIAFLKKYGARPYYEEAPMIRSHYFEMFLAYQMFCLLWSKQFLTTFEFTFMPELFPGGIVQFPEHGIQCYIDEVTHEGSYESGFTTRANLSAPSALPNQGRKGVQAGMIRAGIFDSDGPGNA